MRGYLTQNFSRAIIPPFSAGSLEGERPDS
jgi:hypothetical protein